MSAPPDSTPRVPAIGPESGERSVLSLRALLFGLLMVLVGYVVVLSGILVYRIAPAATRMLDRSHTLVAVFTVRTGMDTVLHAVTLDARRLLRRAAEGDRPATERVRLVAARMRGMSDSTWMLDLSRALATREVGQGLRDHVALAAAALSATTSALVEAANDLELGRRDFAARALDRADSLRQATSGHLLMMEVPALYDLFEGERAVTGAARGARRLVVWWAIGAMLVVGSVITVLVRGLYGPLARVEAGLRRIAAGDFAVELPAGRTDEMGRLTRVFNTMARMLADRSAVAQRRAENLSERLGRVLTESPSEIYVFDAATLRFTQVSEGARRNLGLTAAELQALGPVALLPEFSDESFSAELQPLRDGLADRVVGQTYHRRRDGSLYPVEVTTYLSRRENPPVFVAIAQDITERVQLQAERERILELSADMLIAARTDGTLLRANPAAARELGYAVGELERRSLFDFVESEDHVSLADAIRRLLGGEAIRSFTVRMQRRGGESRWVSLNCDPPVEGVLYVVGRDVTEERRADQEQTAMREVVQRVAEEWTRTFDALEDPIVVVDGEDRVLRLNEGARRLTGRRHAELVGMPLGSLGGEPFARAVQLVADARRSGRPVSAQVRSGLPDRTWDVEAVPAALGSARMQATIVVAHDVSRVVEMQETVRRSETMAAMGTLLAGVAHEVRNPLFSMSATLDAFEERYLGKVSGPHLEIMRAELTRLQHLMQDLLDFGRPQALEVAPTDLAFLLSGAVRGVAPLLEPRGLRVEVAGGPPAGPLQLDHQRMAQVLDNLLANAAHFSPQGGTIVLSVAETHEGGRTWVDLQVRDHGRGFAPDDLAHVFEPFYTKRKGGTGLGLAIVRRIVEQHGGQVEAANAPDGGAVVRLRIPMLGS